MSEQSRGAKHVGRASGAVSRRSTAAQALPWLGELESDKNVVEHFLGWERWENRLRIEVPSDNRWKAHEYPGVYLFADFGRSAPKSVSYDDAAIFYVGQTRRTLGQRWFEYVDWIPDVWAKDPKNIWVAALPTWFGSSDVSTLEPLTAQFRLYTERRIIWEHALKKHRLLNDP